MKNCIYLFLLSLVTIPLQKAQANNLQIDSVTYDATTGELSFDISWENAWSINDITTNSIYTDAVWVFAKYKNSNSLQWKPLVFENQVKVSFESLISGFYDSDRNGIMLFPYSFEGFSSSQFDIETSRVYLKIEESIKEKFVNSSFKVFGIEMVYVSTGEYYLGDGGENNLFRNNLLIDSGPIKINENNRSGVFSRINNSTTSFSFRQDYPSGYEDFYSMKYELSQQQIVDFLNCLTRQQQDSLLSSHLEFSSDLKQYWKEPLSETPARIPVFRNGISCDLSESPGGLPINFSMDLNNNGVLNEEDDGGTLACNFLSLAMILSYLDWAYLRPMTVAEYEKACRGIDMPQPNEFAWGTSSFTSVDEVLLPGTPFEEASNKVAGLANINSSRTGGPMRVGFAATENSDRLSSGGSFYGIMNLSDNLTSFYHLFDSFSNTTSSFSLSSGGNGILDAYGFTDEMDFLNGSFYFSKGDSFFNFFGDSNESVSSKPRMELVPTENRDLYIQGIFDLGLRGAKSDF